MLRGERRAVHLESEQHIALRFRERQTARVIDLVRRTWWFLDRAPVSAFENDVGRILLHSGARKNVAQPDSAPLSVTDRADIPRDAFHLRDEMRPAVSGAFHHCSESVRLESSEI